MTAYWLCRMEAVIVCSPHCLRPCPVPKALAENPLAVPTIISQLVATNDLVYNMVDTIYIGMTGDAYKTAAVTLAFTIFMMTVSFANLFGIGGGSLIARLIGTGRSRDAKR
jgi:multidrug efflux pump